MFERNVTQSWSSCALTSGTTHISSYGNDTGCPHGGALSQVQLFFCRPVSTDPLRGESDLP